MVVVGLEPQHGARREFLESEMPARIGDQRRLAKGVVRRARKIGNAHIFEPSIAKDSARDGLLDEILSFFGGRPQPMMAQLVESGKLTLADIRELEKDVAEAERRRKAERTKKSK